MTARPGVASVPELVLVATLFALVMTGLARFGAHQGRLAAAQRDRVRVEEAMRTTATVLGAELRYLTATDVPAAASDSLRLRAFRGGGPVCERVAGAVWVRYRGARLPEPAKDSVLLVHGPGESTFALAGSGWSDRCGGSMRLDAPGLPADSGAYALIFETGTYALAGGAFRYRRGLAGRQPLTEVILASGAVERAPAGVRLTLSAAADSVPRIPPLTRTLRLDTRNAPPP